MPRPLAEIISHLRACIENQAVSTMLIQTEELTVLCDAASASGADDATALAELRDVYGVPTNAALLHRALTIAQEAAEYKSGTGGTGNSRSPAPPKIRVVKPHGMEIDKHPYRHSDLQRKIEGVLLRELSNRNGTLPTSLKIIDIIAKHAPSPSPVPTDDGLEMAAREAETIPTIRQLVHDLEREVNEVHGGDASVDQFVPILCRLFAERIRALKGNSLPAPAIEDGGYTALKRFKNAAEYCDELGKTDDDYVDIALTAGHIRRASEALQSTTPPAVSPGQVPDGWQPIETAPKDGTEILSWWPIYKLNEVGVLTTEPPEEGQLGCRVVTRMLGERFEDPAFVETIGEWFGDDCEYAPQPTLWRPLPEPPAALDASGEKK